MNSYNEILKYKHGNDDAPLPSASEFIKICEVDLENDDQEVLRKLHGLCMESLYLDLHHNENKKQLLRQTKDLLEQKLKQGKLYYVQTT